MYNKGKYNKDEIRAFKLVESITISSAKLRKVFDGKQYKLTKCFRNKTDATKFAKMLRDRGDFARIHSYKEGHCVYWRLG